MLDHCIYNSLEHILPNTDESKNDTLRLEYLSACKVIESDNNTIMKQISTIPASMYEPLLQSAIYKCYLEFINIEEFDVDDYAIERFEYPDKLLDFLCAKRITWPKSLGILILNWPHKELILRETIPPLHPPIDIFPYHYERRYRHCSRFSQLTNLKQWIGLEESMVEVFQCFCSSLIEFLILTIFKCSPTNNHGYVCKLRRLDVSGLGCFYSTSFISYEYERCFSLHYPPEDLFTGVYDILEGIRNSTIDTFGHKIDIIADADLLLRDYYSPSQEISEFNLLSNIIKESLKPNVGICVYFKTVTAAQFHPYFLGYVPTKVPFPKDFYEVLSLGKCEYIQLWDNDIDESSAENLHFHLPELLGISFPFTTNIGNWNFLSTFKHLEQISCYETINDSLIPSISIMSKGLTYLDLTKCSLQSKDLECLANSKHSETLLQLNLTCNKIRNDSEAVGLITLCQNLKNIKVLIIDNCSLNTLTSDTISKLVSAFKDCGPLELLSMNNIPFNLEISHIITDGLAYKKSLRYLSLNLPGLIRDNLDEWCEPNSVDLEYVQNLCETFHEKINKFRQSPIYISWFLENEF